MNTSFDKSVFRVKSSDSDNSNFGTSFIIHRDDASSYLLTCAHVVEDIGGKDKVCIDDDKASVVAMGAHDGLDLAVLRINRKLEPPALPLCSTGEVGDTVKLYGFRKFDKVFELSPVSYELGRVTWLDFNTFTGRIRAWSLGTEEQEKDDYIKPGYSGSPVVVEKSGMVLGVVSHQIAEGQRARAISIEALGDLWEEMPSDLVGKQVKKPSSQDLRSEQTFQDESEPAGEPEKPPVHCFVILSEADKKAYWHLQTAVDRAVELLTEKEEVLIGKPHYEVAAKIISSKPNFEAAIKNLCIARVAIFDVTHFEPAVMLLLGIRAVVRRGVTILSIGGEEYVIGDQILIPFNIADANLISHSKKQWEDGSRQPNELLKQRIQRGLEQLDSTYYLDLAVFDAVRKLPSGHRGIIPDQEGALVICSFNELYTDNIWKKHLKFGLDYRLKILRKNLVEDQEKKSSLGIARSFELESPRLVSQAIYEYIRRVQTCIVDWTMWSPNVFFELGIRLASSRERTVCVIEKEYRRIIEQLAEREQQEQGDLHREILGKEDFLAESRDISDPSNVRIRSIAKQSCTMLDLFYVFSYDRKIAPLADHSYEEMFGLDARSDVEESNFEQCIGPSSGYVHGVITEAIDIASQPASNPVYKEIFDAAMLYERDSEKSKAVGLYPDNVGLVLAEDRAKFERLLAAWYFLIQHYGKQKIQADVNLGRICSRIANTLLAAHYDAIERYSRQSTPDEDSILNQIVELLPDLPELEETEE